MQFIEKNSFTVRSAIYKLGKQNSAIKIVLFPMVHVGAQKYFDEVGLHLGSCDVVFYEGVKSKKVYLLTLSYRVLQHIKRLNLVTQGQGLNLVSLCGKVINTDISGSDFDKSWTALPLALRAQMLLLIPLYIFYMLIFGSRRVIAENLAVDDLPSSKEVLLQDEESANLDALLIDERDAILLRKLEELDEQNGTETVIVGVVYGAQHMRNVSSLLLGKLKYRVENAKWITVFEL